MTLLTLAEAKAALNITVLTYDVELQDYIDGAIAAVEFICGPAASTAVTEVVEVSGYEIALSKTPVLSVTSVTGDWFGARTISDLHINLDTGVLKAKGNLFPILPDTYTVVYATGRAVTPPAMKLAAKAILLHQWSTQRGTPSAQRRGVSDDSTWVPGYGYIYAEALQMLAPHDRGPAVG